MNRHDRKHPHKELRALLETRFSTDSAVRDAHARDASYHRGALPDAVAFPKTNAEVSEIVKICAKDNIPIVPYGTGTGVEGAVVATEGTLCIALNERRAEQHPPRQSRRQRRYRPSGCNTPAIEHTSHRDWHTTPLLCRSGGRCLIRWDGSDARIGYKCCPIRHDAR